MTTTSASSSRVKPPLVPVTVKVSLPNAAVVPALIVSVEFLDEDELLDENDTKVGEKEPISPDPKPETLKETVPVKPPSRSTVTIYSPEDPRGTFLLPGETDTEKSVTTTTAVSSRVRPPPVPVTVKVSVTNAAVSSALIVSVEVLDEGAVLDENDTEVGEKEPISPDPKPETLKETVPVNVSFRVTVTL